LNEILALLGKGNPERFGHTPPARVRSPLPVSEAEALVAKYLGNRLRCAF